MEGNYSVQIEKFAERHYIKNFEKEKREKKKHHCPHPQKDT
jgi:hypothetical protein